MLNTVLLTMVVVISSAEEPLKKFERRTAVRPPSETRDAQHGSVATRARPLPGVRAQHPGYRGHRVVAETELPLTAPRHLLEVTRGKRTVAAQARQLGFLGRTVSNYYENNGHIQNRTVFNWIQRDVRLGRIHTIRASQP